MWEVQMFVVTETERSTTTTPNGRMATLAASSRGSVELSTWRAEFEEGKGTPVHAVDREQVWMPLSGAFTVEGEGGRVLVVRAGEAVVLPAGVDRRVTALGGPARALVCMPAGGRVTAAGQEGKAPLPWAE
ncbi:cupin domain-containing protein [Streptomyces sp. WMMC897]|uniref:cupin domain-containing protein n=1 Tax=Streptomyces sp. WMMC897 TaxID=3014782 RepID=UPI0022B7355F|nr:cupin domain-containing protein [Streptomyces sp. WMMC897]MCZ7415805.1 cupin domain-containing protein [Streptomyces sp. WMMC897]